MFSDTQSRPSGNSTSCSELLLLLSLLLLQLLEARGRFWRLHGLDAASAGVEQHVRGGRRLLSAPVVVAHSNTSASICERDCATGAGIVELVGGA